MVVPVGHSQFVLIALYVGKTVPTGAVASVVHWQYLLATPALNIALRGHSHNKLVEFQTKAHVFVGRVATAGA